MLATFVYYLLEELDLVLLNMRPVQAASINMQKCCSLHSDGVEEMLNSQRVVLPLSVTACIPGPG